MGMKFDTKGVGAVLSIALPIVSWLIDRFWKKDKEPILAGTDFYSEKKTLEKSG